MKRALLCVTILGFLAISSSIANSNWEFVLGWFSALPVGIYLQDKLGSRDDQT